MTSVQTQHNWPRVARKISYRYGMSAEKTQHIRQLIAQAKLAEASNGQLASHLQAQLPELQRAIKLSPEQAEDFMVAYIEQAPDTMEALQAVLLEARAPAQAKVFLGIAEDYFLQPPNTEEGGYAKESRSDGSPAATLTTTSTPITTPTPSDGAISATSDLLTLLDAAYLAYRLIEEVNDRFHMLCGAPISPTDMSVSNIIVHALLGDEFANKLDMAVLYAIEALFDDECVIRATACADYLKQQKAENWQSLLQRWPCLAGDAGMALDIDEFLAV